MNEEYIIKEYDSGKSTHEIAITLSTYPNKINRILKKYGRKIRDRSEAQKIALDQGKREHPTKGRKRSEEEKNKISKSIYEFCKNMTDEEKENKSKKAKEQWKNMTDEEKMIIQKSAAEAVRVAAKEGSKMEKFLLDKLSRLGYNIAAHYKNILNTGMEVDLFIPELKTVIEIDGPSHFIPIWGDANLLKRQKSDLQKSGLLVSKGFYIIRVKNLAKNTSLQNQNEVLSKIVDCLNDIKNKNVSTKLIELEVK